VTRKPKPKPGNAAWNALSGKDRLHEKHEPLKLRLAPIDVLGRKKI
jgi:hypothetical protein